MASTKGEGGGARNVGRAQSAAKKSTKAPFRSPYRAGGGLPNISGPGLQSGAIRSALTPRKSTVNKKGR